MPEFKSHSRVNIIYVDAETLEQNGVDSLREMDGILIPGGFGPRGSEGMILATKFAREHKIPFLGICLGMQIAIIEFTRHQLGLRDANSTEFDLATHAPVIALVSEWLDHDGQIEQRSEKSDLGGTMRLGGQVCYLQVDSLARQLYGKNSIVESHRHRYEVNNHYVPRIEAVRHENFSAFRRSKISRND